MKTENTEALGR